jgi:gas vesicle protein
MQSILKKMANKSKRLGYIKGESAEDWSKRDPDAAKKFAEVLKSNRDQIVREIAKCVS